MGNLLKCNKPDGVRKKKNIIVIVNGLISCGKSSTLKGFEIPGWVILNRDVLLEKYFFVKLRELFDGHLKEKYKNRSYLKADTLKNQELLNDKTKYICDKEICEKERAKTQPIFLSSVDTMINDVKNLYQGGQNVIFESYFPI